MVHIKETPQQIAQGLLSKKVRYLDLGREGRLGEDEANTSTRPYTVRELLQFEGRGSPQKSIFVNENEDIYRYGHEEIKGKLIELKHALSRLARTGQIDADALRDGEEILPTLIAGIRHEEEFAKQGINPQEAKKGVLMDKFLRGSPRPKARPNDIDAAQQWSLSAYLDFKGVRELLEAMLSATRRINQMIDKPPPNKDITGPIR
jgi:hypothetical protein